MYLFPVHLNIILLVVSDGDDSTKCWNSLFENPGIIEEEFWRILPIRETSLSLVTVFHTSAVLRAACCRTFPDGLFYVYCSRCQTRRVVVLHNFVVHLLQHQWADAKSNTMELWGFAWLINSRNGCRRGGCCCRRQRLQIFISSHAVMVSCLSWFPWTPPPRPQHSHVLQPHVPPPTSEIPVTLGRKNRICCCGGKKIVTSKRRELTCPPQGDHYRNGKGMGIKGTRRFP